MRVSASRLAILLPLVTAAVLALPRSAPAADPVTWRTDYTAARKEAAEKGLALFVVVGTDNCFYCKKLEAGPCRDATVMSLIATNFIPLKLDAGRDSNLVKALKVQLYPTVVMAGPDGKIHAFVEGYVEADRLADQLRRTAGMFTTLDWAARDLEQATRAITAEDYGRAVGLLRTIARDGVDRPAGAKAQQVLDDLERLVASKVSKARDLDQRGHTQDAMDVLAEAIRTYSGTQGATDAALLLTSLSAKPENVEKLRERTAKDLLALAREDSRAGRYFDCLQRCEQLTQYTDLSEGKEAASLAADVRSKPDRLAAACEQMTQRTATLYLTLAESWAAKGQSAEAIACYEKVMAIYPNSRISDIALARLTKLRVDAGLQIKSGP